jgi:thiamine biosynthesis protein ThiS
MQVTVNGRQTEVPEGITVAGLLERLNQDAGRVAVERNLDVVPRRHYASCTLETGDRVEIVTFVGGG